MVLTEIPKDKKEAREEISRLMLRYKRKIKRAKFGKSGFSEEMQQRLLRNAW